MKCKAILFIVLILYVHVLFSQKNQIKYSNICSELIVEVGTKWRSDSVGKLTVRKKFIQQFISVKIDKVTSLEIWKYLGSPCEIWEECDKISYVYYYFYGKRYGFKHYAAYLIFTFDIDSSRLITISEEENDRT